MVDSEERQGVFRADGLQVLCYSSCLTTSGMLCVSKERVKETEKRRVTTQRKNGDDSVCSFLAGFFSYVNQMIEIQIISKLTKSF